MHKRILVWIPALALAVLLTACGQNEPAVPTGMQTTGSETQTDSWTGVDAALPQTRAQATDAQPLTTGTDEADAAQPQTGTTQPQTDASTGSLFRKYVRDVVADGVYTLRTEQSGVSIVIAVDGGDSAVESDAAGLLRFSLVHRGDSYYMIMHTTKKVAKMTEEEYKKQVDTLDSAGVDFSNMRLRASGTETVDGKRYGTETYDEGDQGVVTYFFDETGVRRTRVVRDGKTSMTDVFEVSDGADAALFEIPADYTLVSDPSQLLT